jgi:hypothetical protein
MISKILFAVFFGFSSLSLAAGLFLHRVPHLGHKTSNSLPLSACTNFEGNWHGSCVEQGTTMPDDIFITQVDCTSLSFQAIFLIFGQDLVKQNETSRYTYRFDWNESFNVIQESLKIEAKNAAEPDSSFKTMATAKGTLAIVKDELIYNYRYLRSANSNEDGSPSTTDVLCTYKKI